MTTVALIVDTFREAMARKIFWGLFGLSLLMVLFALLVLRIDVVEGALATVTLFGQEETTKRMDVNSLVRGAHGMIAAFLYTFGMFLAVFASAGLIPSVMEPGRIELVLSKPVSRRHILIGRFLGNVLVVGVNVAFLVLGVWAVFGTKTGIWSPVFLATIPLTLFIFSVLLCVVMLAGVIWESTAVSTMIPVMMMILSPILAQNRVVERLLSSEGSRTLWNWLYYVLPKVFDTGRITLDLVTREGAFVWWPIWTSAAFGIVVFGAALWVFEQRDF